MAEVTGMVSINLGGTPDQGSNHNCKQDNSDNTIFVQGLGKMLKLNLWLIMSDRLELLRQISTRDSL